MIAFEIRAIFDDDVRFCARKTFGSKEMMMRCEFKEEGGGEEEQREREREQQRKQQQQQQQQQPSSPRPRPAARSARSAFRATSQSWRELKVWSTLLHLRIFTYVSHQILYL